MAKAVADELAVAPNTGVLENFIRHLLEENGETRDVSTEADGIFRVMVESLPVAVYTTDAAGRITFFNEAAASLWGRKPRIGEDWWCGSWRLYWPDGRPMAHDECPMAVTLKTGRAVRGAEAVAERPDGSRFPFVPFPTPLRNSSGEMIGALNLLVDIGERKAAERASQQLAAIVESSDDAIATKDLNGILTSWNKSAERLFGYTAEEAVGKPVSILIHPDRQDEEPRILERIRRGERVHHYQTVRRRKDGSDVDISLTVSPIKDAEGRIVGASAIARDVSERVRAEMRFREQAQRLETLNRISKAISGELDLERVVQKVTDIATELTGAQFGAFFYNMVDESGEAYRLYALSGAPREAFAHFGLPRVTKIFEPTFKGTGIVRSGDIRRDPRYGKSAQHHGMPKDHLPVVSYLAVPVVGRSGDVLGGLFFGHERPDAFDAAAEELATGIAGHAAVAFENARLHQAAQAEIESRRRAEEAKALLLAEIKHRVKNTIATVQSIARQTFRRAPAEERDSFAARLQALAAAHDLLTSANWEHAVVSELIRRALAPFMDRNQARIDVDGPEVRLDAQRSLMLAMALHELATNAAKYGALSNASGRVAVTWEVTGSNGTGRLVVRWRETGGPKVSPPRRKGFGSVLIERAFAIGENRSELAFEADGVVCSLDLAL